MDRDSYKRPFQKSKVTKFLCPKCGKGYLTAKEDSFLSHETKESMQARRHEAWDPTWITFVYSCLLECTNSACKETVASSGSGFIDDTYFLNEMDQPQIDFGEYFKPKFFYPHLKIFNIPESTPHVVVKEIDTSFSLVFSDPSSSANHIRVALEHLLTDLKIKRFKNKNGRRLFLTLHQRIDLLPSKYNHVKDLFFAVKWLGNAGSHSSHQVSIDDVFDSYELMNEILVEVFENKRKRAQKLAKKINKRKGPK